MCPLATAIGQRLQILAQILVQALVQVPILPHSSCLPGGKQVVHRQDMGVFVLGRYRLFVKSLEVCD